MILATKAEKKYGGAGMFCGECGKEIPNDAKFCPVCGKNLRGEVPKETITKTKEKPEKKIKDKTETDPQAMIKRKKSPIPKIILALVILGAVIFGAIKGVQYVSAKRQEQFRREMRHAERYMENLEYEKAIASYQAAIKIDPKNPKPYIGIADAYVAMGDYESARDILQEGYDRTGNKKIRDYLDEIEEALESRTKLSGMVIATGVDNEMAGMVIENATIHIEKRTNKTIQDDVETDENGRYEIEDLQPGKYDMQIKADGYLDVEQVVDVYPGQEESYNPVIMLISEEWSGEGTASGIIIDAVNGNGVSGLNLKLRKGYNSTQGAVIEETETSTYGDYVTPQLMAGYYTIEIEDKREGIEEPYLRSYMNIHILGGRNTENQNGSVSTKLLEGQIRIVMSWGPKPNDLDSHLFCLFDNGINHMNFYGNSQYFDTENNEKVVDLDLDDTEQYGPETTTLYSKRPGEYIFGVYNYSGGGDNVLEESQAMVQVYLDNSAAPAYVFYVPQEEGFYWEVFRYDSETERITPINQMYGSYQERDYYSFGMGE